MKKKIWIRVPDHRWFRWDFSIIFLFCLPTSSDFLHLKKNLKNFLHEAACYDLHIGSLYQFDLSAWCLWIFPFSSFGMIHACSFCSYFFSFFYSFSFFCYFQYSSRRDFFSIYKLSKIYLKFWPLLEPPWRLFDNK